MSRFTEHAKEKITIPTKLILTGIKAWVLSDNNYFISDNNYFMYWIWHAKGDGSQEIKVPKPLKKKK